MPVALTSSAVTRAIRSTSGLREQPSPICAGNDGIKNVAMTVHRVYPEVECPDMCCVSVFAESRKGLSASKLLPALDRTTAAEY